LIFPDLLTSQPERNPLSAPKASPQRRLLLLRPPSTPASTKSHSSSRSPPPPAWETSSSPSQQESPSQPPPSLLSCSRPPAAAASAHSRQTQLSLHQPTTSSTTGQPHLHRPENGQGRSPSPQTHGLLLRPNSAVHTVSQQRRPHPATDPPSASSAARSATRSRVEGDETHNS